MKNNMIGIGAVIGDMFGSRYEFKKHWISFDKQEYINFNPSMKISDYDLYRYTDDTILTLATKAALNSLYNGEKVNDLEKEFKYLLIDNFEVLGINNINAGFGRGFLKWLISRSKNPYKSYGNGSAMRVSAIGYVANNIEDTLKLAKISAEITHNSKEGIKGAQSVAAAIFAARYGYNKNEIKDYLEKKFGYNLSISSKDVFSEDNNKKIKGYKLSCQLTVPEAILCFLESNSFEETIINSVALNGDTDTRAAIAGSIAEAFYGVPNEMKDICLSKLPDDIIAVIKRFDDLRKRGK
jgi:ADP-ribosylglycohydrolase